MRSNFRWDWLVGFVASALLIVLTAVVVAGIRAESERNRPLRLPWYSEYVRSRYSLRVPDDPDQLNYIVVVLDRAGRSGDAGLLLHFHQRCSIERLLGTDDACRRATVRSATSMGIPDEDPVLIASGGEPERLVQALSYAIIDASEVTGLVDDRESFLAGHRYIGASLWSDDRGDGHGGYVILGVTNRGPRTVVAIHAELRFVTADHSHTTFIQCGTELPPFHLPAIPAGGTGRMVCPFGREIAAQEMGAFLLAIRNVMEYFVSTRLLELKDPRVTLVDRGANYKPRFAVSRVGLPISSASIEQRIRALPCDVTATCPSWFEPFSRRVLAVLNPAGRRSCGVLVGALMGLMLGGFVRGTRRRLQIGLGIVLLPFVLRVLLLGIGGRGSNGFFALATIKLISVLLEFGVWWVMAFVLTAALMPPLKPRQARSIQSHDA